MELAFGRDCHNVGHLFKLLCAKGRLPIPRGILTPDNAGIVHLDKVFEKIAIVYPETQAILLLLSIMRVMNLHETWTEDQYQSCFEKAGNLLADLDGPLILKLLCKDIGREHLGPIRRSGQAADA